MKSLLPYNRAIAFDCETTGLVVENGDRPFLTVLHSDDGSKPWLCWHDDNRVTHPPEKLPDGTYTEMEVLPYRADEAVRSVLLDPDCVKVGWNLQFDWRMIKALLGVEPVWPWADMRNAMAMLDEEAFPFRLKQCAAAFLKEDTSSASAISVWMETHKKAFKQKYGREMHYGDVPRDMMARYCADDGRYTIKFFYLLMGGLERLHMLSQFNDENLLVPVLISMQEAGCPLDIKHLESEIERAKGMITYQYQKIKEAVGWIPNIASPKQVCELLYSTLGLTCEDFTDSGRPSSGKIALKRHARSNDVVARIKRIRQLEGVIKQATTLIESVRMDGRLHANTNQSGARTGRMSSSDPNLQNLTREGTVKGFSIRTAIKSEPGWTTYHVDYKQVEMVDFADYSQDPIMCEAIRAGEDVHRSTSKRILSVLGRVDPDPTDDERQMAKTCNFAIIYGSGNETFMDTINLDDSIERLVTLSEAAMIRRAYIDGFPGVSLLKSKVGMQVALHRKVTDRFGRAHRLDSSMAYKAINWLVQGGCGTLLKRALIRMHYCQEWHNRQFFEHGHRAPVVQMFLSVHDEIVFRISDFCDSALKQAIVNRMAAAMTHDRDLFSIPLRCDVEVEEGDWGHLKKYPIPKELPWDHPSTGRDAVSDASGVQQWWKSTSTHFE